MKKNKVPLIKKPLLIERIAKLATKEGRLIVHITVDFSDLTDGTDSLNDLADEKIIGTSAVLSDINYRPVKVLKNGKIILEVNADVYGIIEGINEDKNLNL